jgi:dihydrofolate reductase
MNCKSGEVHMKTILWATLSANGNYAQPSPQNPLPPKEALDDFAAHVRVSGNFITGRKTFEEFQANANRRPANAGQAFANTDIVVLCRRGDSIPGVTTVSSPQEALKFLASKGHQTALVTGGQAAHNAFLAEDLVDEVVFNIAPIFEPEGLKIVLPKDGYRTVKFLGFRELGSGVVQLRYAMHHRGAGDGNSAR